MGFFSKPSDMARQTPSQALESATPSTASPEPARPGTSGTEMLLVNNRRRASHRFKDAQKKERDYKTKKRSARARANYAEAKRHFKEGLHHNWTCAKLSWGVVASLGYVIRDKNENLKSEAEEKRKLRAAEKQRKMEERAKKEKELLEKAEGDGATVAEPEAAA